MQVVKPRHEIAEISSIGTALDITWSDGHISTFPSIWLLHACDCKKCGSFESAVRHVRLTDQPARPQIVGADEDRGSLTVDWGDDHLSTFDAAWLRGHCLSESERARRRQTSQLWGPEIMQNMPYMSFIAIDSDPEQHLKFLETVRDVGFVIMQDVPPGREHTEDIVGLVGKRRETNYGIFELEVKPDPEIPGDMSVALDPHTDEPYRIDPPAITLFHVIAQTEDGGDSTMVDGFNLAEILRLRDPEAFEVLCTTPARFRRTLREGRIFETEAPIIARDGDDRIVSIRILDRAMAPVDAPTDRVEAFYDAVKAFLDLVYGDEGRITFKIKPGEMLVFNNQRIMHGRTAFDASITHRHVRSCHVDMDEFHSRLRVAYRAIGSDDAWMAFGKSACG